MLGIEIGHGLSGAIGHHHADGTTRYFSELIDRTKCTGGTLLLGHNILRERVVTDITNNAPILEGYNISSICGIHIVSQEIKTFQLLDKFSGKVDTLILRDVLGCPVFDDGSGRGLGFGRLGNTEPETSSKLTDEIDALLSANGQILVIEALTPEGSEIHLDRLSEKGFRVIDSGEKYLVFQRSK